MYVSNLAVQAGFGENQRNTLEHKLTLFAKLVAEACAEIRDEYAEGSRQNTADICADKIRMLVTHNEKEKQNDDLWWCPNSKMRVHPKEVTYQETHDERFGGCGHNCE